MVDKNEFDSKAAQLESKLNGYKTLILSSDEDEYKIVDSVSDVSVFVKIDNFRNELDAAIREFNEETRSINQAIVNMEVKDTVVLIDKFKTVDDTKLDLKSISDKNKYEIDEYVKNLEKEGKLETAKKVKVKCGQVLRYAVSTGLCDRDVTQDLKGAISPPKVTHMAALIEPKDFALLLQDIDHYEGSVVTQYALRIAPLVFVHPGELRHAKWQDIDLEKGLWSYTPPKTKSKTGVQHIVPLSTQVIHLLSELARITKAKSEYVFSATTSNLKPMSENTINQA